MEGAPANDQVEPLRAGVEPTAEQLEAMRRADPATPVTMLNLLKFRPDASYAPGDGEPTRSGREAYMIYAEASQRLIHALGGYLVFGGAFEQTFIGDEDDVWDRMALVHYPSRGAFLTMIVSPEYQRILHHRIAGLERTKLYQFIGLTADALEL